MKVHSMIVAFAVGWYPLTASANPSVSFGSSMVFDSGFQPSVTLRNSASTACEFSIHQASAAVSPFLMDAAVWNAPLSAGPNEIAGNGSDIQGENNSITWGNLGGSLSGTANWGVQVFETGGILFFTQANIDCPNMVASTFTSPSQYDVGFNPTLASDQVGHLVEVHQASNGSGDLWYRTGFQNANGNVTWNNSVWYDHDGLNPTVAVATNGFVVEVHQGTGNNLWYHYGYLTSTGISQGFQNSGSVGIAGTNPSVAISTNRCSNIAPSLGGVVILAFSEGNPVGNLLTTIGFGAQSGQFGWLGGSGQYGFGANPKIAVTSFCTGGNAVGVEVHQQNAGYGSLLQQQFGLNNP